VVTGFSLLLAAGAVFGLGWCAVRVRPEEALRVADQGLGALFGSLVGARAVFVIVNWGYFENHISETWQIWLGGLSGFGGVYGFMLSILLIAWLMGEDAGGLSDRLLPLGLVLGACAWLAGWWAGSAYGLRVDASDFAAWFALPSKDETGLWDDRRPTQLVGAVLMIFLLGFIERLGWDPPKHWNHKPGRASALVLVGVGGILFGLSFARVDPTILWRGLRLDAWAGMSLLVLGLVATLAAFRTIPAQPDPEM